MPTANRFIIKIELDTQENALKFFFEDDLEPSGEIDLKQRVDIPAAMLERSLGHVFLGMMSSVSGKSLGNRDYLRDQLSRLVSSADDLRKRYDEGDDSVVIEVVIQNVVIAKKTGEMVWLTEAERILKEAAASGVIEAANYLTDRWPTEKRDAMVWIEQRSK